ncbi:MAG: uroporphyrinogen decarboxylase family protein, partial [Spirochaetia bacterium]
ERIIFDSSSEDGNGRIVTRHFDLTNGSWHPYVTVYTAANPPGSYVRPESIGLPPVPDEWKPVVRKKEWPEGRELWELIRCELGEAGILGLGSGMRTALLETEEDIISYYEDSGPWKERSARMMAGLEERMRLIAGMDPRPDFLFCGASGTLITQTPRIVRELTLPLLKKATELAAEIGIPTHIHSCGPEKELVRMAAEETALTVIDPLEVPPMGDCVLSELKQKYGGKLVLKGNLHTTQIMLNGSPKDVREASKKAIDDAAEGGGFILSTGDQCGRDTPDANLFAMIETAYTYGKY